jgi:hypothetical protein
MLMLNKSKAYCIDQSPFYKLRSRKRLASLLKIDPAELISLSRAADGLYSEFQVAKKNGGTRGVENPKRNLKLLQARIARLLGRVKPPEYLFCPVKGRCYVANAAQHRGQRVIHCLDIRKYFPSTSSKRVFWFFNTVMQCERDIAAVLTRLATYEGYLPTGSPLSPILAFFAHYDVWETIWRICRREGYTLTVYIDDVTISGMALSPAAIWEIKRSIHGAGLRYHKEKRYIDRPAEITGVIVDSGTLLPPNRQLKKLTQTRAALRRSLPAETAKKFQSRLLEHYPIKTHHSRMRRSNFCIRRA